MSSAGLAARGALGSVGFVFILDQLIELFGTNNFDQLTVDLTDVPVGGVTFNQGPHSFPGGRCSGSGRLYLSQGLSLSTFLYYCVCRRLYADTAPEVSAFPLGALTATL